MSLRQLLPARRIWLGAVVGAVALFLAYPPAGLYPLVLFAMVPLLQELELQHEEGASGWQAFLAGYWFGVLAQGLVLYWMVVALWHFTPLSLAGYLASIFIVLSPQWGFAAWATARIRRATSLPLWLVFPVAWTATEWISGHYSDLRFPWLGLGTALAGSPVLAQAADLAGARGLTFLVALVNVLLMFPPTARDWSLRRRLPWYLAAAAVVAALAGYGRWRIRNLEPRLVTAARVAVIQPNVGFDEKREGRDDDRIVQQLLDMSRRAVALDSGVQLVAWPEAAVPNYFYSRPDWEALVASLAAELRRPILAGGLDVEFRGERNYDNYNAAFFFDSTGRSGSWPSYRKTYLVPIVERVPFVNPDWFGNLRYFGGFERGRRFPVYIAGAGRGRFGVLICYESAFEDLARRYRRNGADFLLNITNDAWFGRTAAPYQHAAHLVLRAIEVRAGIARAANTGISGFVDPLGRLHDATPLFTEEIRIGAVQTTEVRTLYLRLGDWVGLLSLGGTALSLAWSMRRRGAAASSS